MYRLCVIVYQLLTIVYSTGGSFLCKDETCSCCRSGTCADPHQHVLPCQGCIDGYAGPSCYEPCPEGCVNCSQLFYEYESERECYQCKTGYFNGKYKDIGSYPIQQDCSLPCIENCEMCTSYYNCSRCKPQFYRVYEKGCIKCQDNCLQCTSGIDCLACEDGHVWDGKFCAACEAAYFGKNCSARCPNTCKNNQCHKSTGRCIFCNDGYFMNQDKICLKCSLNCINDTCRNTDGKCILGCEHGYWGEKCEYNCSKDCVDRKCERSDGSCFKLCNKTDNSGTYTCVCPTNCECDKNNSCARCLNTYGEKCDTPCSKGCVDTICDRKTGECLNGCLSGLSGSDCSIGPENEEKMKMSPATVVFAVAVSLLAVFALGFSVYLILIRKGYLSFYKFRICLQRPPNSEEKRMTISGTAEDKATCANFTSTDSLVDKEQAATC